MTDLWESVDDLWTWLDENRAHGGREGLLLRVLKLSEEVGEVAQAVIGATGQNPRKGVTHTWEDVEGEALRCRDHRPGRPAHPHPRHPRGVHPPSGEGHRTLPRAGRGCSSVGPTPVPLSW